MSPLAASASGPRPSIEFGFISSPPIAEQSVLNAISTKKYLRYLAGD